MGQGAAILGCMGVYSSDGLINIKHGSNKQFVNFEQVVIQFNYDKGYSKKLHIALKAK